MARITSRTGVTIPAQRASGDGPFEQRRTRSRPRRTDRCVRPCRCAARAATSTGQPDRGPPAGVRRRGPWRGRTRGCWWWRTARRTSPATRRRRSATLVEVRAPACGPDAGQVALAQAGVPRDQAFVTNAVKHFKVHDATRHVAAHPQGNRRTGPVVVDERQLALGRLGRLGPDGAVGQAGHRVRPRVMTKGLGSGTLQRARRRRFRCSASPSPSARPVRKRCNSPIRHRAWNGVRV